MTDNTNTENNNTKNKSTFKVIIAAAAVIVVVAAIFLLSRGNNNVTGKWTVEDVELEFMSNGDWYSDGFKLGTYTVDNDLISMTRSGESASLVFTFKINGDTMTFKSVDSSEDDMVLQRVK